MRRHFDTHPDRDPTLLREVRLAYHSNLSNPHLNLTLPEDKWLEIGAKVQLPLLKTRRLVQARVLWLIGHQPAFDDPTIARDGAFDGKSQ